MKKLGNKGGTEEENHGLPIVSGPGILRAELV